MLLLVALILFISLSQAQSARAEVLPCERVIHFPREIAVRHEPYPLYFNCFGQDKAVKNIAIAGMTSSVGASVSTHVKYAGHGMGRYLEIVPNSGPGRVQIGVVAQGDSGQSYKTMIEIIME